MAWTKLASGTLTSNAETIESGTFSSNKNFIIYMSQIVATGSTEAQFHDENVGAGTLYAFRFSTSGGADTAVGTRDYIKINDGTIVQYFITGYMSNIASQEKLHYHFVATNGAVGAATVPIRVEVAAKYVQTSTQVPSIDIDDVGTGSFGTDTNLSAVGTD